MDTLMLLVLITFIKNSIGEMRFSYAELVTGVEIVSHTISTSTVRSAVSKYKIFNV